MLLFRCDDTVLGVQTTRSALRRRGRGTGPCSAVFFKARQSSHGSTIAPYSSYDDKGPLGCTHLAAPRRQYLSVPFLNCRTACILMTALCWSLPRSKSRLQKISTKDE